MFPDWQVVRVAVNELEGKHFRNQRQPLSRGTL
jgi:hypothetical protein